MIWVVTHKNDRTNFIHLNTYWDEFAENLNLEYGYEVSIIDGSSGPMFTDPLISDAHFKAIQTQKICNLFQNRVVKDGDIFIFTDGWHSGVISLSYFRQEFKLNIKFIAFWTDSYFSDSHKKWIRMYVGSKAVEDWAKNFEKGYLQSYDYNCYKNDSRLINHKTRYRSVYSHQQCRVTGTPFEYIYKRGIDVEFERKENIIVFPWPITDEYFDYFKLLAPDFPDWQFVSVVNNGATRLQYLDLLRRAKILFSPMSNRRDHVDMTVLYEALCYGCYPLISDAAPLKNIFSGRYRFDRNIFSNKSRLKFLRTRFALGDRIQEVIDNYSLLYEEMRNDALSIKKNYYSDEIFIQIIESCR